MLSGTDSPPQQCGRIWSNWSQRHWSAACWFRGSSWLRQYAASGYAVVIALRISKGITGIPTKAAVVTITSNDFKLVLFCWHPVIDFWFRFAYTLNFSPAMVNATDPDFPVYHPIATRSKLELRVCLPREIVDWQFSDLVGDVHLPHGPEVPLHGISHL